MTKRRLFVSSVMIVLLAIGMGFIIYLSIILAGNYVIDNKKLVMHNASSLVDEEGNLLTKLFIENRENVAIQKVPDYVVEAFVAIEDTRFFDHQGVDFRSIGRALYRDILAGSKVEGGSTITQQLVKNTFLSHEKTFLRKTKEVLISMNLERKYSKLEILEFYLNRIYFGHGAYGIQAASKLYFNKDVEELTIEEGALLAALPKAPNAYSPINYPERSKQRRDVVLSVMERNGYLSPEEAVRLQGKTVAIQQNQVSKREEYLTYIDMVLDEAEQKYQISSEELLTGGYTIIVPMKVELQESVYEKFQENEHFPGEDPNVESAIVLMDVQTGGVLAAQGGREYVSKGINRVNVRRQPGSVIKPLAVFGPAIETGQYHPYSMLNDNLINYDGYEPRNYNQEYKGEVPLVDALTYSLNAPAVWLFNELGVDRGKSFLDQLDLSTEDDGLALALGGMTEGFSPLEVTKAYRTLAYEGKYVDHYFIKELYDQDGQLLKVNNEGNEKQVFSEQTAWYLTRMLELVVSKGTAMSGFTNEPLAGKTGTTSFTAISGGARDAWFAGYTPNVVGAIWMGHDRTTETSYLKGGSSYPTALFKEILNDLPEDLKSTSFSRPMAVHDLDPPIVLEKVSDLKASLAFGGKRLLSVKLNWTHSEDERVRYHIYEVTNERGAQKIGFIDGSGEYLISSINLFHLHEYFVVPYDYLTDREGPASNVSPVSRPFGL
ncbi:transglycosylase domain-containing protein [Alkalihalobacterium alkalinitrilicum]|uniref:transglycosylase domain-containing protein n=1 Tax=Alkalihalobacterium alkalinitrilicum TaxID=427920 RepID=UPI0009950BAC|nr:PBP1A family penicillin-binding protein [Alkalihalobacterium alkalinitrilicum]